MGNIPFHLTTPILRRLLAGARWQHAVLLTQWEVARKRASVGGHTMLTAQTAPWFEFALAGRVPAWCFTPRPSVDGGLLTICRRDCPLVPVLERRAYENFVRAVFTGRAATSIALSNEPRGSTLAPHDALLPWLGFLAETGPAISTPFNGPRSGLPSRESVLTGHWGRRAGFVGLAGFRSGRDPCQGGFRVSLLTNVPKTHESRGFGRHESAIPPLNPRGAS